MTHDHGNNASSSDGEDVPLRALGPWIDPRLGRGKLRQGKQLTPTANTGNAGGTTKEDNSKNESRSSSPNGEEPGKSASSSGDGDEEVDTMDTISNVEEGDKKDTSNVEWAAKNAMNRGTTDTASQGSNSDDLSGLVIDPHALEINQPNGLYGGQGEGENAYF